MSLDYTAYFRTRPKALPFPRRGADWILQVEEPAAIEADDLSPGLRALLGRCRWQVEIHLEGSTCADATGALAGITAEFVAISLGVLDHQRDVLLDRSGEREVPTLDPGDDENGYSLQLYFEQADQFTTERMAEILQLIEAELPEALPHRYGLWEPLQQRWDDGGAAAFLKLWSLQEPPFWKGKGPVASGSCSFDYRVADYGFRAGTLRIRFRAALGADAGKFMAALRLGERLALATDAFYAALVTGSQDQGPFWRGMVPAEHHLLVIRDPLLSRWPEFRQIGRPLGTRHFSASGLSGTPRTNPPVDLCYRQFDGSGSGQRSPAGLDYAPIFPFDRTDPYQPR